MGGTVAMIVRKPEGFEPEVQPMLRWTNPLPYHLAKSSFLSGDFDRWWPDFAKEWEDGQRKSTSKVDDPKAPFGYGLVVVDFQSKTVLHAQGYCSFGAEALFRWNDLEPEEIADLRRKHQAGFIPELVIDCLDESKPRDERIVPVTVPVQELGQKGLDKIIDIGLNAFGNQGPTTLGQACKALGVEVPSGFDPNLATRAHMWDMPYATEWKFERFEESAPGYAKMRQRAEEIGLSFSPEDDKAWHSWIVGKLEKPDLNDYDEKELVEVKAELAADIDASLGLLGWPEDASEFESVAGRPRAGKGPRP